MASDGSCSSITLEPLQGTPWRHRQDGTDHLSSSQQSLSQVPWKAGCRHPIQGGQGCCPKRGPVQVPSSTTVALSMSAEGTEKTQPSLIHQFPSHHLDFPGLPGATFYNSR